jgi:hypothetical protein
MQPIHSAGLAGPAREILQQRLERKHTLTASYDVHVKTRRLPKITNPRWELYGFPQDSRLRGLQDCILFHLFCELHSSRKSVARPGVPNADEMSPTGDNVASPLAKTYVADISGLVYDARMADYVRYRTMAITLRRSVSRYV